MPLIAKWGARCLLVAAMVCAAAAPTWARLSPDDPEQKNIDAYYREVMARMNTASNRPGASPMAIPDVFGPGAVLDVGNVVMKIANSGVLGNPFTASSSDPS